jgi:branched-chain amino acid transport system ATP-binding protein
MSHAAVEINPDDLVFNVEGVTLRFGGVTSLNNVTLQMRRGEILAVIGPNGAGKTSLFNSLTGVYSPQEGTITARARAGSEPVSVIGKPTHVVNQLGVARTFQNIRLFPALTALENVKVGIETRQKSGPIAAMLGMPWQRREEAESTRRAYELMLRVGLDGRANEIASSLSYGEQRRLEIARALGTQPGVILLDEPAAGTNPVEKRELASLIKSINVDDGVGVLLIEHDMKLVMSVADRIIIRRRVPNERACTFRRHPPLRCSVASAPYDARDGRCLMSVLLDVEDLEVRYGAIRAIKGISFHVNEGEIVALLGANGAGKTTTQKTVSGMLRPSGGSITFAGERIDGIPAHELISHGVCHVPEGRHVFPRMTVHENLEMGAFRFKKPDMTVYERVLELFPRLRERITQQAGTLSGGEQQMLAIGRAMMGKPRLLLLDEPSMGLAPLIVAQIFDIVREINKEGVTVLLVEQNAAQALALANRGYVLETGELVLSGTGQELLADDRIRAAYLGEEIAS